MKRLILLLSLLFISLTANAQSKLSGSLYYDSYLFCEAAAVNGSDTNSIITGERKSPLLSAALSFVLPGAGQFYNGDYWKTGVFLAAEIALITAGVIYDNKGDDQTVVFESFANTNWNAAKYARWSMDNFAAALQSELGIDVASKYSALFTDASRSSINNWLLINQLENDIASLPSRIGSYYSHRLEHFGEQQYYEMIGKYKQFNVGWSDFNESGPFNYTDPVTPNFSYYSGLMYDANSYYNIASKAVVIVIVNHVISAVEAAYSAHVNNKRLQINVSLNKKQFLWIADYYPQLNFKINL